MRRQRRSRGQPGHGVEHARRENLAGQLGQPQHGQRRLLARLDDDRVPGGQGGRGLLGEVDRRPVERQDRGDHAVGLVDHPGLDRALVDDLAVQRLAQAGVVVEAG